MKKFSLFVVASVIVLVSCSKSSGGGTTNPGGFVPDCSTAKTFSGDVLPIISSSCAAAGCHASGSFNGPGALTNYSQVAAAKSAIRSAVAAGTMPKTGSLSAAQKSAIVCWIDAGAANN